jgi:hypothetical protein
LHFQRLKKVLGEEIEGSLPCNALDNDSKEVEPKAIVPGGPRFVGER